MKNGKLRKIGWKSRRAAWAGSLLIGMTIASAALQAQSVSFAGVQTTVASGFGFQGVAVDKAGSVFISESSNNQVIELPANGGP